MAAETTNNSLDLLASVVSSESLKDQETIPKKESSVENSKKRPIIKIAAPELKKRIITNGSDQPEAVDVNLLSPPPQVVAEQMRASMKLKEQQKAIIESRRNSVPLTPSGLGPNVNRHKISVSTDVKRQDFAAPSPMRELPPPSPYSQSGNRNALPPMNTVRAGTGFQTHQPQSANIRSSSRAEFMRYFDQVFDQADQVGNMVGTLNEQIRHATSLLQTLQGSGSMIEGLVRGHFREMQSQYGEKFGTALTDLNRRLSIIEQRLGVISNVEKSDSIKTETDEISRTTNLSNESSEQQHKE